MSDVEKQAVEIIAKAFFADAFKENDMSWEDWPEAHEPSRSRAVAALADLKAAGLSLVPSEGVEWQPIETAPRDGSFILAIRAERGHRVSCVIYWDSEFEEWSGRTTHDVAMMVAHQPTHWMPLPAPPEEA